MTVTGSIGLNSFGQDIVDTVKPLLSTLGLLDSQDNLDINNWSLDKAMNLFSTYERTDSILNFLSAFLAMPESHHRSTTDGLFVDQVNALLLIDEKMNGFHSHQVSSNLGWKLVNKSRRPSPKGNSVGTNIHQHTLELGIGFIINNLEITGKQLDCKLVVPLLHLCW